MEKSIKPKKSTCKSLGVVNANKKNQCRQHHRTECQPTWGGDNGLIIANLARVKNENKWEKPQRKEKKTGGGESQRKGRIIAGGGGPSGRGDVSQMVKVAADGRAGRRGADRSHLSRRLWIWPTLAAPLPASTWATGHLTPTGFGHSQDAVCSCAGIPYTFLGC